VLGCNQSHANLQLQSAKRYPAVGLSLQVRCVLDTRQCANLPERVADKLFGLHWNLAGSQHLDPRDTKTIFDIYIYICKLWEASLTASGFEPRLDKRAYRPHPGQVNFFCKGSPLLATCRPRMCVERSTGMCGLQHRSVWTAAHNWRKCTSVCVCRPPERDLI